MARRRTGFRNWKSIAGIALVAIGMFVLHENPAGAATWFRHVVGINGSDNTGVLPGVVLAVSQALQAYGADRQRFLDGFSEQIVMSCWPMLLVMFGKMLLRDGFADDVHASRKKVAKLSIWRRLARRHSRVSQIGSARNPN